MHTAALHLAPILGAEKSKVPFYVAGGVLVAWALIVSLGVGLRRADFPPTAALERAVIAVTAVLVIAAASTAVITSGSTAKAGAETGSTQAASPAGGSASAPTPSAPATTSTPATTPASTPAPQPKATTGAPAAPGSPAPASATTSLKLLASPEGLLSYNAKQLSAKSGTVTIDFTNNAPLEHDVTIAQGTTVLGATPTFRGASRNLTLKLKPGKYAFYCSVPGHRQAGMEGTLSVS
jgi:plastocyanin